MLGQRINRMKAFGDATLMLTPNIPRDEYGNFPSPCLSDKHGL